ncbi:hypothetical protein [Novosphingobium sp.]|jgi:hypothetical protein|uniref:hypothetical protein n=1 Tax=Novosphingobium sp. TaxID=1874826 RepID=UPI0022C279B5|nr:hypothetical protein [Novosphingobium sp.]MCZ8017984.1 hypothetical protein [Novosphingobium sp.]MCZ8034303.1 hypothetical protein [Novosphingobium sp.]MCZ8052271.1 hypothetical protein [Novosphingobium sp.]MCZ8061301.1 hypothetical protein [Novosphingobium sp.]MCZ8232767.1 hypothetical protein [Novosphingobium sp.]
MTEAKPLASLSPSLLARKGAARPAMRPQLGAVAPDALARQIQDMSWSDDLGWNDMGEDHDSVVPGAVHHQQHSAEPAALPAGQVVPIMPEALVPAAAELPEVVRQQAEVAAIVREKVRPQAQTETQIQSKSKPLAVAAERTGTKRRSALASGRRAAFTLRVDADRHLKLRLACAIRNRSAQQLVTEALDRLLDELPDVTDLAAQLARADSQL